MTPTLNPSIQFVEGWNKPWMCNTMPPDMPWEKIPGSFLGDLGVRVSVICLVSTFGGGQGVSMVVICLAAVPLHMVSQLDM